MTDAQKKRLEEAGIGVDEVLERFMNNEALMLKFLLRFPDDPNFLQLREAMTRQDAEEAFRAAHTLKGITGNLAMHALYQLVSETVEDLRRGDLPKAQSRMEDLEGLYASMSETIRALG